jgi:hypothetical protein
VVADFTSIRLEAAGKDRVRVSGITGGPQPDTYKVSISYLEGYKAVGQLTVSGPDAEAKARICADVIWKTLGPIGRDVRADDSPELVGVDACHGPMTRGRGEPGEIVMRVGVKDRERSKVDRFGKELAAWSRPALPASTGFAGGRPEGDRSARLLARPLIPKRLVSPPGRVEEVS